uniref:Uncharacterized protein n=1 Tax=Anguilla anguilla TaxID=7936 RepID=A0A0E9V310_ANGAN
MQYCMVSTSWGIELGSQWTVQEEE